MVTSLPYSPTQSLEWLEGYFKKHYFKKPYNKFMWWRSYTPIKKPLDRRAIFRDKLKNGDFDMAPYYFEAQIVEHKMNEKFIDCDGDQVIFRDVTKLDCARRKRLLEDFDKEETERLEELRKLFILEFNMTGEQYDREVVKPSKNLLGFYDKMKKKFGLRGWVTRKSVLD